MASLDLVQVHKRYDAVHIVKGVSLSIADGEFLVLVGPSGCGKSTTLRMIAGLEEISDGEIRIGGKRVNEQPPKDRDIAMVFQSYALYPHMSVRQNMGFGLTLRKQAPALIDERVNAAAKLLAIEHLLERRPKQLSGGQRQRVAIGRAIVRDPSLFLFDEPLSNLDAALRVQMRSEIAGLHRRLGTTMVYVTHDQVEAMMLATRIAVLDGGVLRQCGTPDQLYHRPANRFVAGFIGTPAMNLIDGEFAAGAFVAPDLRLPLTARLRDGAALPGDGAPGAGSVGVRPHDVEVISSASAPIEDAAEFVGDVIVKEPMGWEAYLHIKCASGTWIARVDARAQPEVAQQVAVGDQVRLRIRAQHVHGFASDGEAFLHASEGRAHPGAPPP